MMKTAAPPPPREAGQAPTLSFGQELAMLHAMKEQDKLKEPTPSRPNPMQQLAMQPAQNAMGAVGNALGGYAQGYQQLEDKRAQQRQAAGMNSPAAWLATAMKG